MSIKKCVCNHSYQDYLYGEKNRVMNPQKDGGWRCTSCGKSLSLVVDKKKGK